VSGDRREIRQSYLPTLFPRLVEPLQERGSVSLILPFHLSVPAEDVLIKLETSQEAVPEVIELMDEYYLTKEDWDAIVELGIGEGFSQEEVLKAIPTATKTAFTRK